MVLPTENTLPVSPVDHLSTSRFTSCCPPTSQLPSNRRRHLSVTPELSLQFWSLLFFWGSSCLIDLFIVCMNLPQSLPPSFPSLSLVPSSCSPPDTDLPDCSCHNSNFPPVCEPHKVSTGNRKRERAGLKYAKSAGRDISRCDSGKMPKTIMPGHTQVLFNSLWAACKTNLTTLPLWLHQMLTLCWKIIDWSHCMTFRRATPTTYLEALQAFNLLPFQASFARVVSRRFVRQISEKGQFAMHHLLLIKDIEQQHWFFFYFIFY